MTKANLVALLHALSGGAAIAASIYTETGLLASVSFVRPLGFVIFAAGMLLFVVCVTYLKQAFLGEVEPVTDRLITTGPYRWVRHPLYLSMIVAAMGIAVLLRSLWGMLITLAVFFPAALWRARLEEQALARRFSQQWQDYAARTFFLLPPIW